MRDMLAAPPAPRTQWNYVPMAPLVHRTGNRSGGRILLSAGMCSAVLIFTLAVSEECRHWFVLPLLCCGILCCVDGLRLFEKDGLELFSPRAILGAFGVYCFFIAPLAHVARDFWFFSPTFSPSDRPEDWRPWLGMMGLLNLGGLILYKRTFQVFHRRYQRSTRQTVSLLNQRALRSWGPIVLCICFALQVYVYAMFGGIGGFINAYESVITGRGASFQGLGWLMCIGESFPLVLLIVSAARFNTSARQWKAGKTFLVLGALFALILVFGGLRGSRGNTVYAVLYAAGIIHLTVRRLSWRMLAVMGAGLILFMYLYGFYKVNQQTLLSAISSQEAMLNEGERSGRTLDAVLLGDMERADIQAFTLFRIIREGSDVDLAYGRTYFDSALNFIPYGVFSYRPPGKIKYGTNLFFGNNTYVQGGFGSTKIYGLAGEAMLNFGPLGAILAFLALGWAAAFTQTLCQDLTPLDSRRFAAPILSIACLVGVASDLDNVLYLMLRQALVPLFLLWLCSTTRRAHSSELALRASR